ncbi:GntR family transcriptional regulator [Rhodobacterales bacterium]|nr:GntR family transcriptional regulator [Rhodobacterales bacterium]
MAETTSNIDARLPAYLRLRDELAARVAAGEWRADEALPSDNRLAREGNLSVGTVRKAVQMLVDEGLLERRQGSGTYLRKPAFNATLFRFFQMRDAGSGQSIPTSRLISRKQMTAPSGVAEVLGTNDVIRIERLRDFADRPFLSEEIYIPTNLFSGFEAMPDKEVGPLLYPVYLEHFGVFVASADDEVSFGTADETTAKRLGIGPGEAIAVIERTAYCISGTPVEWRIARGPANRFRYRSRIG